MVVPREFTTLSAQSTTVLKSRAGNRGVFPVAMRGCICEYSDVAISWEVNCGAMLDRRAGRENDNREISLNGSPPMLDSLDAVLEEQIKDLYSAENQLVKALPQMASAASTESLKECFKSHLAETKVHVERLAKIAEMLEIKPGGKKCKGMEGLLEEGKEAMEEKGEDAFVDAAIIAAAQRVEHYEISGYGTARAIAEAVGNTKVAQLLQLTLDEEAAADEKLTQISTSELLNAGTRNGDRNGQNGEKEGASNGSRSRGSSRSSSTSPR